MAKIRNRENASFYKKGRLLRGAQDPSHRARNLPRGHLSLETLAKSLRQTSQTLCTPMKKSVFSEQSRPHGWTARGEFAKVSLRQTSSDRGAVRKSSRPRGCPTTTAKGQTAEAQRVAVRGGARRRRRKVKPPKRKGRRVFEAGSAENIRRTPARTAVRRSYRPLFHCHGAASIDAAFLSLLETLAFTPRRRRAQPLGDFP